jgi:hypothetical protein
MINLLNLIILIEWAFTIECLKGKLLNFPSYYCQHRMLLVDCLDRGEAESDLVGRLGTLWAEILYG